MAIFSNKRKHDGDPGLDPDEVLIDAKNLPSFDTGRFEGRIEQAITKRTVFVLGLFFVLVGAVYVGRVSFLQVALGNAYAARSQDNSLRHEIIFPKRGVIYDRRGTLLAYNDPYRVYNPQNGLAHLLGFIGLPTKEDIENGRAVHYKELIGKDGVEKEYDSILRGETGIKIEEVDVAGNIISESVQVLPKDGRDLTLSIDSRVEKKLYEAIASLAKERGFSGGAGVIIDVHSGEILALASYPEYSLALLSTSTSADELGKLINDPRTPFLNRAVSGAFTPGSIVKLFLAIGALNEGVITPEKKILSTGSISIPNPYDPTKKSVFLDWKAHGWVDMVRALAVSSDVYFYEVGGGFEKQRGIGIGGIDRYARLFGFGSQTGVDLPAEVEGVIPTPEWKKENFDGDPWRLGDTYHTAIGQYGFQVTPIQMARAVGAISTKGVLPTPTVVASSSASSLTLTKKVLDIPHRYFDVVSEGMRQAVIGGGTAQTLAGLNISLGAKTGTAELGITKKSVNSWTVGFFPFETPRYAFAVVMEKGPRANLVGAVFAAKELLGWMQIYTPEYLR